MRTVLMSLVVLWCLLAIILPVILGQQAQDNWDREKQQDQGRRHGALNSAAAHLNRPLQLRKSRLSFSKSAYLSHEPGESSAPATAGAQRGQNERTSIGALSFSRDDVDYSITRDEMDTSRDKLDTDRDRMDFSISLNDSSFSLNNKTRHLDNSGENSATGEFQPLILSVTAPDYFGAVTLVLTRITEFLSPGFVIQRVQGNVSWLEEVQDTGVDCYYSGIVLEHPEGSNVAISLCDGVRGIIEMNGDRYYVQPASNTSAQFGSTSSKSSVFSSYSLHHKSHTVTKLSAKNVHSSSNCSISENFKHHRLKSLQEKLGVYKRLTYSSKYEQYRHGRGGEEAYRWRGTTGGRQRRSVGVSRKHTVETLVVADAKMYDYHKTDVQQYVLTLMSIVKSIYQNPSIRNFINVVVVKLVIFETSWEQPFKVTNNAATSLKDFCLWQHKINDLNTNSEQHFDTAILLTREDICRAQGKCDTLGLAELGTVCDGRRSCSIIEDNGISAAFTIAHELGHVFNLPHDDDKQCSELLPDDQKLAFHVMSPTLDYNASPWDWSNCSANLMTEFLESGLATCLHDGTRVKTWTKTMQAFKDPGTTYKVHQQCKLVFGQDFVECPFSNNPLCRRLWCTNKNENNTGCRTKHMPWADGTPCAPNKECQQGTCLPIPSSKPTVVNGGWGPWSSYGRCSRTCESGVKTKYRECNNPYPANGGKYCLGSRERYKSCNIKVPCPPDAKDFRQVQCESEQMKRKFSYLLTNFTWTAKFSGAHKRDNCKLYCGNHNSTSYLEFSKKVIDGTTCGQYTDDVCVNGQCWAVGCDRRLGSTRKRDECGKCGGDGSTCRFVTGVFNNAIYGYNFITRIPAEATDIEIRQFGQTRHVKDDDNYLALKDANGTWILNGEYTVRTESWKIKMKQALLEYSGSEQLVERINTTMMIKEDINLYVLSVGKLYPPNITFSYMISVSVNMTKYSWKSQGWTKCNALCNGERRSQPVCVNLETSKRVNSRECKEEKPPDPTIERCNRECKLRWHVVRQEDCSVRCGRGERQQVVQCIKDFANKTTETVNDLECIKVHGSKQEYIPCQGQCLPTYWTYTEWSKCSVTCGEGVQQRQAKCVDKNNKELPDSECKDKVTMRTCRYKECPEWIISKWHECSVTCGRGYVQRKVWCMRADQRVDDAECNKTKPEDKRDCEMRKCPEWVPGGWGPCSVTCGLGVSMRAMKCVDNSNGRINREDEVCDPSTRPSDKKSCFMGECPTTTTTTQKTLAKAAYWKYGYWTECSTTCGSGTKHRVVSCIDYNGLTVKETECSHLPRPNNEESCMLKPCGNWRRGDWTDCSVTCGDGIQTRFVACTFKEQRHDERFCDITIKPETEIQCNRGTCLSHDDLSIAVITSNKVVGTSHWRVGSWSSCSNTCGTGWERRVVMCRDETGPSNECDKKLKPDEFHACDSGPCPSWHYDPTWSNCSASKCHETGLQNRLVVCRLPNGDVLANSNCDHRNKPQESQVCKGLCEKPEIEGAWKEGQWSACSVTCGHGMRVRNVTCVGGKGKDIPYYLCTKKKPRNIKRCLRGHCPRWHTGHWSKCSTSCGPGERTREIKCKDKRHRFVDPGLCENELRPKTTMACVRKECATYRWEVGPWSECSKTCGFGRKHRSVTCIEHGGSRVSVHLCDSDTKPKIKRRCSEFPCPYIWNTGPWSECSATCGEGKQTRTVVCQAVTKEGWILPGEVHYGCRPSEKPVPTRYCIYGDCGSKNHWFAGQWEECSSPCGHGTQTRQVICVNKHKVQTKRNSCAPLYRPEISRPCYNGHCYATSCKEFKNLTTIRKDADYQLKVGNQLVKIFCKDMQKKEPKEYISLPQGPSENFAEMFDKQLKDPTNCPYEGKRPEENCSECRRKSFDQAGNSSFSKIRINLNTLTVIISDSEFSNVESGSFVPYATGGDCYSSSNCPQGHFRINLLDTGFIVSVNTTWNLQGNRASQRIWRLREGQIIKGVCGGYCGVCSPDPKIGLKLDLLR